MSEDARYAKNAGAVFSLEYQVAWCSKYRLAVLEPPVDRRLKELIGEVAEQREMRVLEMEVMPDHVRLLLQADPRWAPASIAGRFKAVTSRILTQEFPHLRTRMPTLWSRSYFIATVGAVSETTIRRYVEAQRRR